MKNITLLFILSIFVLNVGNAQIAFQGFEGSASDTWNYTSNITPYIIPNTAANNDDDIWNVYSGQLIGGANATVTGARTGNNYFAGLDLDNPHSEAATGDTTPDHYLDFEAVNIGGIAVDFTMWCEFEGYDSSDFIFYELFYDNGTDWSTPDVHVDINSKPSDSNSNSQGTTWEEFKTTIPSGITHVRLRIGAHQNGNSDFLGFDDISLEAATLSNNSNQFIEGLTYGPNPTQDIININATQNIQSIVVYSILGNEIKTIKNANLKNVKVDLEHEPKGLYFLKLTSQQGVTQTISVIKK